MARKPRLRVPGGVTHVMLRGNGGADIFFSKADRRLNTEHVTRHAAFARHLEGLNTASLTPFPFYARPSSASS